MFPAPAMPEFPPGQSTVTTTVVRYEDLSQEGRYLPVALPSIQAGLWRDVLTAHAGARNSLKSGVVPVLTRMVMTSLPQPIHVNRPIETHAGFELAHGVDETGAVNKLFMLVWAEVRGAAGRVSPNSQPGPLALAGRLFAEQTFTRLMAPPDQRKVVRLEVEGYPSVPAQRYRQAPPATAQEAPEGATWLDALAPDPAEYAFSLDQTDANQHVNSLVYVRLFLEAANRRFAARGKGGQLRTREVDIAYRKPSFAGERVRAQVRMFEHRDGVGVSGYIATDDGKPRAYVRAIID
ncbi:hypothetical protein BH11MYX1_BH11MYX1_18020 [soil metagenome]